MKRLLTIAGLAAGCAWSAPAVAQCYPNHPDIKCSSIGGAVTETVATAARNDGASEGVISATLQAIKDLNTSIYNSTCGAGKTWLCVAIYLEVPTGSKVSNGFGGAGATGTWEEECDDFELRFDAGNNLLIPSIAAGGGPLTNGSPYWTSTQSGTWAYAGDTFNNSSRMGATRDAIGTYATHAKNFESSARNTGDKRDWYGMGWYDPTHSPKAFHICSQAFYNTAGVYRPRQCAWSGAIEAPNMYGQLVGGAPDARFKPCPVSDSGGDADYYAADFGNHCFTYVPNYNLGPAGYAVSDVYPVEVFDYRAVGFADKFAHLKPCQLNKEFLRQIANRMWDKASDVPGYSGAPYDPAQPDEVKTGGEQPTVDDLDDQADIPVEESETPGTPIEPTPTPTPTPTGGITYDPTVTNPDLDAPAIDWWPDLPSITLDLGSPTCPTYSLDLPQWEESFVMTSHCDMIEVARPILSVLMVSLFAIGSIFIVLRA